MHSTKPQDFYPMMINHMQKAEDLVVYVFEDRRKSKLSCLAGFEGEIYAIDTLIPRHRKQYLQQVDRAQTLQRMFNTLSAVKHFGNEEFMRASNDRFNFPTRDWPKIIPQVSVLQSREELSVIEAELRTHKVSS